MSRIVGILLHTALTAAGHPEWDRFDTWHDFASDMIVVTFHHGQAPDGKYVTFSIPNTLFDPVEYARAKWPKWFVAKREPRQLDLFKQE